MSKNNHKNRDNTIGVLERRNENERRPCACYGCSLTRHRFSQYCKEHYKRNTKLGNPHQRTLVGSLELKEYRRRVGAFLRRALMNQDKTINPYHGHLNATKDEEAIITASIKKASDILQNPKTLSSLEISQRAHYPLKSYKQEGFRLSPNIEQVMQSLYASETTLLGYILGTRLFCRDYPELLMSGDPLILETAKSFLRLCRTHSVLGKKIYLSKVDKINLGLRLLVHFEELSDVLYKKLDRETIFQGTEEDWNKRNYFRGLVESYKKNNKNITFEMLDSTHRHLFNGKPYKPRPRQPKGEMKL